MKKRECVCVSERERKERERKRERERERERERWRRERPCREFVTFVKYLKLFILQMNKYEMYKYI